MTAASGDNDHDDNDDKEHDDDNDRSGDVARWLDPFPWGQATWIDE